MRGICHVLNHQPVQYNSPLKRGETGVCNLFRLHSVREIPLFSLLHKEEAGDFFLTSSLFLANRLATDRNEQAFFLCAKLLDINPHTLRARMRKLDIDWKKYRYNG